ncbi:MAG: glycosyltransferase, partial [Pseudomonadota bacterium]
MSPGAMPFAGTVLQVVPELDAGGAERTTVEIAAAVIAAGGRALVASRGGRLAAEIERLGGEVTPMPVHSKNPSTILANARRLEALARANNVDIIHVRSRAPAWSALFAARRAGAPLVATHHGAYGAKTPWKRLYNSGLTRADLVIANSEFTADAVRRTYPRRADRVVVIPRGADTDVFDPAAVSPERVSALARAWNASASEGAFRILAPGRFTSWKGQEDVVDAIALLAGNSSERADSPLPDAGQRRNFELVFCGDSQGRRSYTESIERRIEERGVGAMVNIAGHCSDMPAAYAWADLVLSPSRRPEAFGRVAAEAGAMETLVIAA